MLVGYAEEFASLAKPSAMEIFAFQEQFYTLILKSLSAERRQIANILARESFTPRSIAYYFCLDKLEIAAPVLRYSPVLNSRDFISLVMRSDLEHVRVIAQRDDLDIETVNAIIALDPDDHSLIDLMRNSDHLMGQASIRSAVNRAKGIFYEGSIGPREPIGLGLVSEDDVTDLSGALLNLAAVGGKTGRRQRHVQREKSSFTSVLEERLLRHTRDLNFEAFAYAIERECRLPAKFVMSVLELKNAGDLATILVGLEISQLIASRLMLILIPDLGRNIEVFRLVFENYTKLSKDECRDFLSGKGAHFGKPLQVYVSGNKSERTAIEQSAAEKRQRREAQAA